MHDAGEDGGELLLGGAAYDGLLVRAVLCPQGGHQTHKHRQDVGPDLEFTHDDITITLHDLYRSKQDELCFTVCQI